MAAIANSYFNTLQQNDGTVYAPFDQECNRIENGVQTTSNPELAKRTTAPGGLAVFAMGCEAQFKTGFLHFVTAIRDRRITLIDEQRGLVLAAAFFDHAGTMRSVKLTDGRTVPVGLDTPFTWQINELFKVKNGKIRRVEAVLVAPPYGMHDDWAK